MLEMVKACGLAVTPEVATKTRPVGETCAGAAVPDGTMLSTTVIEMGGCTPSVGVSVTAP